MINVYNAFNIVLFVLLGVTVLLFIPRIVYHILGCTKAQKFKAAKADHRFAVLIPARNESSVIKQLLESIKNQNYDQSKLDIYVIVESLDDPTCVICEEFENVHVFCRQHLELKGKGYALDECLQKILKDEKTKAEDEKYEAYFIIDADNVLSKNFFFEMNKVFDAGYDVGNCYRACKNFDDSWISACSGVYFTMQSTLRCKPKSKLGLAVQVTGTGYYISAKIINKLGGWKFNTLTEDAEFTMHAILNDYKTAYNDNTKYYDEQPSKFSVSYKQRVRWCKGFMQVGKLYNKILFKNMKGKSVKKKFDIVDNVLSLAPLVSGLVAVIVYEIATLTLFIVGLAMHNSLWYLPFIGFICINLSFYLFLVIYTAFLIFVDRKRINCKFSSAVGACLMYPFFCLLYIPIFFTALLKKDVEWTPIAHNVTMQPGDIDA